MQIDGKRCLIVEAAHSNAGLLLLLCICLSTYSCASGPNPGATEQGNAYYAYNQKPFQSGKELVPSDARFAFVRQDEILYVGNDGKVYYAYNQRPFQSGKELVPFDARFAFVFKDSIDYVGSDGKVYSAYDNHGGTVLIPSEARFVFVREGEILFIK